MFGISAALTTPFDSGGEIDISQLNEHINAVFSASCSSATLFGTTGEGASVSESERFDVLHAVVAAGTDPAKLVLTLHGIAVVDIVRQIESALETGVSRFLLPPPYYFSDPSENGLFSWFAGVLEPFKKSTAEFILYHIPQVIGVGVPIDVVARLNSAYPDIVFGVKDSSGSYDNARKLLQLPNLEILIGDERLLAKCVGLGASGAISGIANLFADRLTQVLVTGDNDPGINNLVDAVLQYPVTSAIKSLVAYKYSSPQWRNMRAPLVSIPDSDYAVLAQAYDRLTSEKSSREPVET